MKPTKSSLPPGRKRLLELMQQVNFGRIEGLVVRDGEPVIQDTAPPHVVFEVKFGGDNGPRAEAATGDFALKQQVVELFEYFDRVRNALIVVLTVKHGLPFGMHVETNL